MTTSLLVWIRGRRSARAYGPAASRAISLAAPGAISLAASWRSRCCPQVRIGSAELADPARVPGQGPRRASRSVWPPPSRPVWPPPVRSVWPPPHRSLTPPRYRGPTIFTRSRHAWSPARGVLLGEQSGARGGPPAPLAREASTGRGAHRPCLHSRPPRPRPGRVLQRSERPGARAKRRGSEEEPRGTATRVLSRAPRSRSLVAYDVVAPRVPRARRGSRRRERLRTGR